MRYYSLTHDYDGRKIKKRKPKGEVFTKYKKPMSGVNKMPSYSYRGMDTQYASREATVYTCHKTESPKYTGTLVKGISTMHKSNAVPIINESEAKEHASMRR
jgi:hypothetical protein